MHCDVIETVKAIEGVFTEIPKHVPTNGEPDGPLCGNGDIGVTNSCRPKHGALDFYLSKNDFWYTDLTSDRAAGDRPGMRCFGTLSIGSEALKDGRYSARQRILDATVCATLTNGASSLTVSCRVLRKTNLIQWSIQGEGSPLPVWVRFAPTYRDGDETQFSSCVSGNRMTVEKNFAEPKFEWPVKAKMIATIWGKERFAFLLNPGETVIITAPFYTNQDGEEYQALCDADSRIGPDALMTLTDAHTAWWRDFWSGSSVSLPNEPQIERHWYASHYLMACCCESGKFPPGIFGNWVTNDSPNWGGDYHMNYNYQAPWWGCYSSNKIFLSDVYDRPLLDFAPKARAAARQKLGCDGLYLLVGIGPRGLQTANIHTPDGSDDPNFWGQKSNAAYTAVNMLMRHFYEYDEGYDTGESLGYLLSVADFWEDYLKFEDGRYVIYNDCIHENGAVAKGVLDWVSDDTPDYSEDFNPILSLGLLRYLFRGLLDISETYGICGERREKWRHILDHLSNFPVQERNGRTVFRYTERGMDWCDSNSLGVQHIFPANAIGLSSPPETLQIARNTLEELSRWEDYNAFPTFFTAAARIGYDQDVILSKMNAEIKKHGFPNFFIYYGGGGIECCSAIPSCINEMLLQSHEEALRFFPVWDGDASFTDLRAYGAFLVSARKEGSEIHSVSVYSEKGRRCTVFSPWTEGVTVRCDGNIVEVLKENGKFSFKTQEGKRYRLEKKNAII